MDKKSGAEDHGKKWLKISLLSPGRLAESVSDLIGVLSGSGVEISPETDKGCIISGFFPLEERTTASQEEATRRVLDDVEKKTGDLFALYQCPAPELTCEVIADQDWATSWKQFFTPFEIIPGLVIKPSWETYAPEPGQRIIEMDPGMAFGTGQHASTKMALSLISCCFKQNSPETVLDVGTGTGILAMASALFGAEKVIAIDNDLNAVNAATDNVR
ncbi:MAG: methyltransferase, partial [Desulfobulbaceae bacterium]|nr:methyltransferase [Desulfobulbaceae bacterium]